MSHEVLRTVLAAYPADCRPLAPPQPLGNAGGFSGARLWRFAAGRGTLLLRAWPPGSPDRTTLECIHGWLGSLRDLPFIPLPIADREGHTFQHVAGPLWQLEPWMPGEAEPDRPPQRDRLGAGFVGLGALHAALVHQGGVGPSVGLAARAHEITAWLTSGFDELAGHLRRAPASAERELATQWSRLARRLAPAVVEELRREASRPVPVQPCLRDARPEHFLFRDATLTGLVDFGAMAVESPAADLARLLADWVGEDRALRGSALTAYESVFPLGPDTSRLIGVFERSTSLLIGGHWARWHYRENRTFDDPQAVRKGLVRGVDRIMGLTDAAGWTSLRSR